MIVLIGLDSEIIQQLMSMGFVSPENLESVCESLVLILSIDSVLISNRDVVTKRIKRCASITSLKRRRKREKRRFVRALFCFISLHLPEGRLEPSVIPI